MRTNSVTLHASPTRPGGLGRLYVVDVAITLTIQSRAIDKNTGDFQKETKALLNVSPRNVFNVWQAASLNITDRIQPIPPEVTALLIHHHHDYSTIEVEIHDARGNRVPAG